ncbi:hypothetical protein [Candidatus Methylomirabilis limnetica]|uniref:hypothetical protein n=1 Tax=Candidatus Methylomirabilis limnetica TaxID=2033718 RepID=UPI00105753B5|nr:hypothetical protein [Candidatus Methylomirabilis limnetica]
MATKAKNYRRGATWVLLSPLLFVMAAISTVESLTTYYVQLVCFSIVSIAGVVTGVGFVFGWPWANISAKYIAGIVIVYFVCSWLLIALFLAYEMISGM